MSQATNRRYSYSPRHRAVEILSISAVFSMLVWFTWRCALVASHTGPWGWLALLSIGLLGFIGADLVSGLVHWAGDTIGDTTVPFLGKNFIGPFREHHVDPKAITRHDFVETNGNNCIVVAGPLGLALWGTPEALDWRFVACSVICTMSLFTVATNQFHKWAHADHTPAAVKSLQRMGLILSPQHHDIHHAMPHDKHYCITAGWMNPVLDKVRFFRGLEAVIHRVNPSLLHIDERLAFVAAERERRQIPRRHA